MTIRDQAYGGRPLAPFIIDAHTHLSYYYRSGWHQKPGYGDLKQIMHIYDTLGVDCIVTAPHELIDGVTVRANEVASQAAAEFPGRVYGYISVAPLDGMDVLKRSLARYGADPAFVGLKFLGNYNGDYTDPVYMYALDFADEAGCPVLCHTWSNRPSLELMRDMAASHRNANIVCAHLGGGSEPYTLKAARIVNELDNFHLEICGSLWSTYGIEDVVDMVGADRVIFGSDAVNLDARFDFGRVAFAPLDDDVKTRIFSGNFLRLLIKSQMGKIVRREDKQYV